MAVDSSELKIAVEKPSAWGRELTITVPAQHVERERAAALSRLAGKVRLPGFRKGKVPAGVIQKRFGPAVEQEMLEHVIGEAYREALKREGLQPITQANVDRVDYKAGTDLTFHVAVEVRPELDLERIGGFRVKRETQPVPEDQVDAVLDRLRDQQTVWHPKTEGPIANGDMVVVEITPIETDGPGKLRSYQLVLGEGQAAASIEDVIRSMAPGEEGDFTVQLRDRPDDPSSEEKSHNIHLRVVEAKQAERPNADDEFARGVGEFGSIADLRARVRADLEAEAGREADRQARLRLVHQIIEANPFEVPDSMVDDYLQRLVPDREGEEAAKLAEARQAVRPAAADAIKRMLVIDRIADLESLHATPEEVETRVADVAVRLGRPEADVRARFAKNGRLAEMENEITEHKVLDYLTTLSSIE